MRGDIPVQEKLNKYDPRRDFSPVRVDLSKRDIRVTNIGDTLTKSGRHIFSTVEFRTSPNGPYKTMTGVSAVTVRLNVNANVYEVVVWVFPDRFNGPKDWLVPTHVESGPKV